MKKATDRQRRLALGSFFLVIFGGLAIRYLTAPGACYAELAKPSLNPPNWLFAPVWTVFYILIAIAGWRIFERDRRLAEKFGGCNSC